MERKYLELLSIGEIAKLAEVHPKSIRYYERLGIFNPLLTDPETGYRYYSPQQIHHLFAIKTCIHFGIPLRDFPKYYQNGMLFTNRYLQDASTKFRESIRAMLDNLAFLENLQTYIGQSDQLIREQGILTLPQPERTFLIREISQNLSFHRLFDVYADLNLAAKQHMIEANPFYGRIALFQQGQLEHLYAAVQVSYGIEGYNTLTLPAASYASLYTKDSHLLQAPDLFPEQASPDKELLFFESNCVASQYNVKSPGYILRLIHL